ncbi:class I SAM-dependent methyltransferase [Nonomuraea longicatena]|uniref:Class I SAM-dependent methyltransferase n=1 Tax=Nonomuraea longicatena TaxID=83682 RepID=A0ABP4B1F6_9ACTN
MSRWTDLTGGRGGERYAERFAALAASGADVHGEATLCASLVPVGARVLDAGCGTGRVAIRLAELGYDVVGVDLDASMLAVAARLAPDLTWVAADLADLADPAGPTDLADPAGLAGREGLAGLGEFDLVVAAGNVIPLLAEGTEPRIMANLAAAAKPGGLVVTGFGLDAAHLPVAPTFTLAEYDRWCAAAGLTLERRYSTWDTRPFADDGYAVSLHRRR